MPCQVILGKMRREQTSEDDTLLGKLMDRWAVEVEQVGCSCWLIDVRI